MRLGVSTCLRGLALAAVLALPAHADPIADFYKDRTVTLIAGYSAGGGFDLYARIFANHFGKHIPGNPRVIVQNMPGAGSTNAANYLYNVSPKDGSVIALTRAPVIAPLVGANGANFDATKFTWLGSGASDLTVCGLTAIPKSTPWQTRRKTQFTLGGLGPGSDEDMYSKILKKLLGLKIHLVTGYPGGAELILAVERGELDGRCGWAYSSIKISKPQWIAEKKIKILNVLALERSPELPDVPAIMEFATASVRSRFSNSCSTRRRWDAPSPRPPAFRPIAPRHCARRSTIPRPIRRCWPR